jgi:hypothetical protein
LRKPRSNAQSVVLHLASDHFELVQDTRRNTPLPGIFFNEHSLQLAHAWMKRPKRAKAKRTFVKPSNDKRPSRPLYIRRAKGITAVAIPFQQLHRQVLDKVQSLVTTWALDSHKNLSNSHHLYQSQYCQ